MQKLDLTVEYADASTRKIIVPPAVQVAFERHFKMSIAEAQNIEHLYWLAFETLRKKGDAGVTDFDAWLELVAAIASEDEPADPTAATPSPT